MLVLFYATYWFWVTMKILLCALLVMGLMGDPPIGRPLPKESLINLAFIAEIILLFITFVNDFTKENILGIMKIISGSVFVIFSIYLMVTLLNIPEESQGDMYTLGMPLSVLIFLIGIFDILRIKRPPNNDY